MAVPSNGSLNMSGLAKEKLFDDYNSSSTAIGPIYMSDLVTGGNSSGSAQSYDVTNTSSPFFPDNLTPHAFGEWYGYNHDAQAQTGFGYYELFERAYPLLFTAGSYALNPDPIVRAATGGQDPRWRSFDLPVPSEWANMFIRPQALFYQSNQDFRNDVALSAQWVWLDSSKEFISTAFSLSETGYPSPNTGQKEDGQAFPLDDPEANRSWKNITSLINNNEWSIETLETPSNGTGPEEDPFYGPDPSTVQDRGVRWYQVGGEMENRPRYFYYESSGAYTPPQHKWWRYENPVQVPSGARYLSFAYSAWSEDGAIDFENDYLKVWIELVDMGIAPPPTFS